MKGLLNLVGMSVGGWIGWIGWVVGIVGTGVGLYFTQRTLSRLLP